MRVVDERNFATGVLYLFVGAAVALTATRYQLGSSDRLGPGFLPFAAAVTLAVLGIWLMVRATGRSASGSTIGSWSGKSLVIVLSSIVLFGLLLERAGLLIAVPVLVGLSSRAHPGFSWRTLGISVLVLLGLTWTIFVLLLGLPFPMLPVFLTQ